MNSGETRLASQGGRLRGGAGSQPGAIIRLVILRPGLRLGLGIFAALIWSGAPSASQAAEEPAFCSLSAFLRSEVRAPVVTGIERLRLFKLGAVTLGGMAVGAAKAEEVKAVARTFAAPADGGYCTWYLNQGNPEAERAFNFHYLGSPLQLSAEEAASNFTAELTGSFAAKGAGTFLDCAEKYHYVAMGCHGQMHRGPSAFGMLLAFSGCTPEHAQEIVDFLWGLNGIKPQVRGAIIRSGYELGNRSPELRARWVRLLSRAE